MSDEPDVTIEDVKAIAQRALAKVSDQERRIDALEAELEDVQTEVTRQGLRLSEYDEDRAYDQLTIDDKVGLVRETAFKKATESGGRTTLDYDDIQWIVFDGEPYPAHCYKLMRLAAGYDPDDGTSTVPGFRYREPQDGNRHLAVDATEARNHSAAFLAENKTDVEVDAR
jgi:hypothetical protein